MRIGMMIGEGAGESPAIDEVIRRARRAEEVGLTTGWLAQIFSHDAINLLALVGRETTKIELGTAVVPTYPRHPAVMAQAALTTQVACEGRFTLGIGLSHKMVIDGMYGLPYKRHMAHIRVRQSSIVETNTVPIWRFPFPVQRRFRSCWPHWGRRCWTYAGARLQEL